ncbi:HNH endonuclease [Nonomuraea angiospora]|uniref:HNH endonuclease n=1 Tax=Nonomuraea angiospora TaxID=46172 RepID=UPI00341CDA35
MKVYVGVTDGSWYRFLSARPSLTEVNFWRPSSSREFRALDHGEPFFFKTHHPHNRVVGGGFFSGFAPLRVSEAWEFFGQGNGSSSLGELRHQVGRYRSQPIDPGEDPVIGCVIIRDAFFFPDDRIAGPPPDFASNIVQGKSYDLASHPAADYFHDLLHRIGIGVNIDLSEPWHRDGPVYGDPRLAPRRLGQLAFQAVVLHAYERRCAISGDRIRPVLQAAHIRPVAAGGQHRLDNGLLLRSDIHTLFDRGYLAIDPKHRLLVSPRLREEFGNGEEFYRRAGQEIHVPIRPRDRPHPETLEWHVDEVFLRT